MSRHRGNVAPDTTTVNGRPGEHPPGGRKPLNVKPPPSSFNPLSNGPPSAVSAIIPGWYPKTPLPHVPEDDTWDNYEVEPEAVAKTNSRHYVIKGKRRLDGVTLAMKHLQKRDCHVAAKELEIWRGLSHPNILQFIGVQTIGDERFLLSPWMANGSLALYLRENPSADRARLLRETAAALVFLHRDTKIIHGNIRASNILVSDTVTALLCDFGRSQEEEKDEDLERKAGEESLRWLCPKILEGLWARSFATDIYAFGMTIYQVLSGQVPFHSSRTLEQVVQQLHLSQRPETEPRSSPTGVSYVPLWNIAERCWDEEPEARPDIVVVYGELLLSAPLRPGSPDMRDPPPPSATSAGPELPGAFPTSTTKRRQSSLSSMLSQRLTPIAGLFDSFVGLFRRKTDPPRTSYPANSNDGPLAEVQLQDSPRSMSSNLPEFSSPPQPSGPLVVYSTPPDEQAPVTTPSSTAALTEPPPSLSQAEVRSTSSPHLVVSSGRDTPDVIATSTPATSDLCHSNNGPSPETSSKSEKPNRFTKIFKARRASSDSSTTPDHKLAPSSPRFVSALLMRDGIRPGTPVGHTPPMTAGFLQAQDESRRGLVRQLGNKIIGRKNTPPKPPAAVPPAPDPSIFVVPHLHSSRRAPNPPGEIEKREESEASAFNDRVFPLKVLDFGFRKGDKRRSILKIIDLDNLPPPPDPAPGGFLRPLEPAEVAKLNNQASDSDQVPHKPGFKTGFYRALYPFKAEGTNEVDLEVDELYECDSRGGTPGDGWLVVARLKGRNVEYGLAPERYLDFVRPW